MWVVLGVGRRVRVREGRGVEGVVSVRWILPHASGPRCMGWELQAWYWRRSKDRRRHATMEIADERSLQGSEAEHA